MQTVFIVDDNDTNLIMAASILENDYMVLTMSSAERMFKIIEKKRPHLILLDIEMPGMTGFEALAELRNNPEWRDIPVLFLTGWVDDTVESKASELGVRCIIHKPIVREVLLDSVSKHINN
jgi:CheY-like chemotaxis protein